MLKTLWGGAVGLALVAFMVALGVWGIIRGIWHSVTRIPATCYACGVRQQSRWLPVMDGLLCDDCYLDGAEERLGVPIVESCTTD